MYRWQIDVRRYFRDVGYFQIDAGPREQGYLEEFPFLRQLIPLGRPVERNSIKVKRLDAKAMSECLFHDVHLVRDDGRIIATTSSYSFWDLQDLGDVVERLLRKAGPVLDQVRWVVTTGNYYWQRTPLLCFRATIYKLSKTETPTTHIVRVVADYREVKKQAAEKKAEDKRQVALAARREARRLKRP